MSHFYSHQQPVIPRKQSDKHGALKGGGPQYFILQELGQHSEFSFILPCALIGGYTEIHCQSCRGKEPGMNSSQTHSCWIISSATYSGYELKYLVLSGLISSSSTPLCHTPPPSNNAYPAEYCEDENYVNSECNRFWNWLLLYNGSDYNYHIIRPGKRRVWDEYFNHYIYNRFSAF